MNKIPMKKIEEKEFDNFTFDSHITSLVFFGAMRCVVCREQIPIIEEIAYEYKDKMNVYWVDVDKYKLLFYRFRLQGIPNILIFSKGEVREKIRGLNSKQTLIQVINNILDGSY